MSVSSMEKYNVPVIPASSIKRVRLVSLMQSLSSRGVLFVHAPAGYGKTTATIQWIGAKNSKAAWFSLDAYDTSISDFYRGLAMAFLSCGMGSENAELIRIAINDEGFNAFPLQHTLALFAKLNFDLGPQTVVIDDFHLFRDPYVTASLPVLRNRLPIHVRLVILSRTPPDEMLNDYILKEMLKQISFEELLFTDTEVSKLFLKHGTKLSDYDAVKIQKQTMGWPAALSAWILFSTKGGKNGLFLNHKIKDNEYLYHYIKYQIYEFWDDKTRSILYKTSICEFVTPGLCERLTGQKDAWDTLVRLSLKTGLAMGYGTGSYRYQKLFRDFLLSELESDETIDKKALYVSAGLWYKENGNIPAALDMGTRSGDIALLEDIARLHSYAYGRFNTGVDSYVQDVYHHVLRKLPTEIIEKSPRLCLECWFTTYAIGSFDESKKWMCLVKKYVSSGAVTQPRDMFMVFFQFAVDSEKDPWFMISLLRQMDLKAELLPTFDSPGKKSLPAFTLTYNMPFYHKAQRDYTEISPALDEYIGELSSYLPQVLSPFHELLALLIEGGVRFERHEIAKAKECARRACELAEGSSPELMFASLMLLCDIYWAEGNTTELDSLRSRADEMITTANAFYLTANFSAYVTNLALYNGDTVSAGSWLENNMISDKYTWPPGQYTECVRGYTPTLYKSFQDLTTARSLIVMGNLAKATVFLEEICGFSITYRRTADLIEAGALRAVCLWRMKNYDEAAQALIEAIITAQKYALPMPIVKQGADIAPVLQKLLNRLRVGYEVEKLDKAFVGMLFINARIFAEHYCGFFAKTRVKPVKLSPKQALILTYLSQNLSYREMSELTDTKLTTIRDHVTKLYQKLGVNNATDALLKAKEQDIL